VLVDGLGLLISARFGPASDHDQRGAKGLLAGLKPLQPRLAVVYGDGAYAGEALASWCRAFAGVGMRVVRWPRIPRFEVLPRRWVVERTFAWLGRNRRLAKDYVGRVQTTELLVEIAMVGLTVRRLVPL
jgi:transposase